MKPLWILIWVGLSPVGWAASTVEIATQWLERMNQAILSLNYEGHFVYQCDKSLEAMQIRHWVGEEGTHEALYALTGTAKEVLRDDKSLTIITNQQGRLHIRQQPAQDYLTPVKSLDTRYLQNYYHFEMGPPTRMAGREGVVIRLLPKDDFRYGYQLTLDKLTALPLGLEVLDRHGRLRSRIMFTDLQVDLPDGQQKLPSVATVAMRTTIQNQSQSPERARQTSKKWRFEHTPPGYRLIKYHVLEEQAIEHFVFSDGMASVSVYLEPVEDGHYFQGVTRLGAVNALGRRLGKHQLTLVGEVPLRTLEALAASVQKIER